MKGMQKMASLFMGVSALAFAAAPGMMSVPATAAATQLPVGVDLAIVRAASATTATSTEIKVQNSGGVDEIVEIVEVSECIVKFFRPEELKIKHHRDYDYNYNNEGKYSGPRYNNNDDPTVIQLQVKIICSDIVGTSELLIEQNDRLVVADTVRNHQTDVSMHSLTVKLNEEQEDTFCVAVARSGDDAEFGTVGVVSQQCFDNLGEDNHLYSGR